MARVMGYKESVAWVAENESAGEDALDVKACSELITAVLVADIFGKDPIKVGQDIVNYRIKSGRWTAEKYKVYKP